MQAAKQAAKPAAQPEAKQSTHSASADSTIYAGAPDKPETESTTQPATDNTPYEPYFAILALGVVFMVVMLSILAHNTPTNVPERLETHQSPIDSETVLPLPIAIPRDDATIQPEPNGTIDKYASSEKALADLDAKLATEHEAKAAAERDAKFAAERRAKSAAEHDAKLAAERAKYSAATRAYNQGCQKLVAKDYRAAVSSFNFAAHFFENFKQAYNNRAFALINLGQPQRAIKDCDRAIKIDSDYAAAFSNRAGARLQQKEFAKALDDANRAIKLDSSNGYAYLYRSMARRQLYGDESSDDRNRAIELKPELAEFVLPPASD
jgi:tetratricopeptide (TPR) repeat protein